MERSSKELINSYSVGKDINTQKIVLKKDFLMNNNASVHVDAISKSCPNIISFECKEPFYDVAGVKMEF